jgi:outer membrane biosynthesis protein TonB
VIHGTADQRRRIEEALRQWKFKPYQINGHPSPVETGLEFKFKPEATSQ